MVKYKEHNEEVCNLRTLQIAEQKEFGMKKREQYKGLIRFWAAAILVLLQTGSFAYVWFAWYGDLGILFAMRGNLVMIGLHALMMSAFMKVNGNVKLGQVRIRKMLSSQFIAIGCVNLITYLQVCLIGRWSFMKNISPMLYLTVVDCAAAFVWILIANLIYRKLYPPKQMLIVYGGNRPERLISKLKLRKDKYTVCETISVESGWDAVVEKMNQYNTVLISDVVAPMRDEIMKYCFNESIICYIMPDISDIMMMGAEKIQISDTTMLMLRNQGLSAGQRCIKRIFDIVVGVVAMIVTTPVMIVIAIAIKSYDGGPVFFKQSRLTRDGKVFEIIKFRSMRVQTEDDKNCITRKNDDRITPVGHIIRKLHLDELPQIINIIKGEMSFVGPRPEWTATTEQYAQNLPEFLLRLKVKAGLTGYAQIYGKYSSTPYDKLLLDLTYIEKYSFLLDLKLMFLTLKVLLGDENAEGVEAWQTSAEVDEAPDNHE